MHVKIHNTITLYFNKINNRQRGVSDLSTTNNNQFLTCMLTTELSYLFRYKHSKPQIIDSYRQHKCHTASIYTQTSFQVWTGHSVKLSGLIYSGYANSMLCVWLQIGAAFV